MAKVTWEGIKVCPVPGCNKGHDRGPYVGPMGDLGKHIALSRDFPHTAWKRARKIPECPLPSEPGWRTKGQRVIREVMLTLLQEFAQTDTC